MCSILILIVFAIEMLVVVAEGNSDLLDRNDVVITGQFEADLIDHVMFHTGGDLFLMLEDTKFSSNHWIVLEGKKKTDDQSFKYYIDRYLSDGWDFVGAIDRLDTERKVLVKKLLSLGLIYGDHNSDDSKRLKEEVSDLPSKIDDLKLVVGIRTCKVSRL